MKATSIFVLIFIVIVILVSGFILLYMATFYPIKYKEQIKSASATTDIPASLIASVINAESRFDTNAVSRAGAIGLMQLLPSTASEMAEKLDIPNFVESDLFLPETNILLGTHYLRELINEFDDTATALCAYNAGPSKVRSWLQDPQYSEDGKTLLITPYQETNEYLSKIIRCQKIYENYF